MSVLAKINWRSRFIVGILLLAAAWLLLAADSTALWGAATLLIAALAAGEWAVLAGFKGARARLFYAAFFLVLAAAGEFWLFAGELSHRPLWTAAAVFWGFVAPWMILREKTGPKIVSGAAGMLLLYAAWQAGKFLYERDGHMLIAGLGAVCLFDIFAFIIGRAIGRTKLSAVSPKKTVEGLVGGMTVVAAAALLFKVQIGVQEAALVLSAALAAVMLATIGDLFESNLKRRAGVKDSGSTLGDHGGILDRMDGLLPVLPFAALLSPWV